MTSTIDTVVGIILCVATVIGTYLTIRSGARRRVEADRVAQANVEAAAIEEGKNSRNDEVALLRSQRDDARRERDRANTRADTFEARYNDLRDRGQK